MSSSHGSPPNDNPSLSLAVEVASGDDDRASRWVLQSSAPRPQHSEALSAYLQASLSANTRRAYRADLDAFVASGGQIPTSPLKLSTYLASLASRLSPFTLERRAVAIGQVHVALGLPNPSKDPLVRRTLAGIRRTRGTAQRCVDPLLREDLLVIVDTMPDTARALRDRAVLLLGFAGAFRRGELVEMMIEDLRFVTEGLIVTLRRSKTDQERRGRDVAIPWGRSRACPIKALKAWLVRIQCDAGPLFRSIIGDDGLTEKPMTGGCVALIVKEHVARLGLDPGRYSGHSLRAGFVTSAAKCGVSGWKIRQQTGHKSDAMVLRYIRDAELFVNNAASYLL